MLKEKFEQRVVFIVGNSRSGTTMMMRVMNNHSELHSINEPHFFEKIWTPKDEGKRVSREEAFEVFASLFTCQRAGFFEPVRKHVHKYKDEINTLIERIGDDLTRLHIYNEFLENEATSHEKITPCEKTPQNVYYLKEIFRHFPNARIINMVRDPRAIMLSQKRKWLRRSLGASFMTRREVLRLRINYHPYAVSKLWKGAITASEPFQKDERVFTVRFEDVVDSPKETMSSICEFLSIPFEEDMLMVPHSGSSSESDSSDKKGLRKTRIDGWLANGLTKTEIQICQNTCGPLMKKYGYDLVDIKANPVELAWRYAYFPPKMLAALIINLPRKRNIIDTIRRRLKNQ